MLLFRVYKAIINDIVYGEYNNGYTVYMKRFISKIIFSLFAIVILAGGAGLFVPERALAFNPRDYFDFSYSFSLSKTDIAENEQFTLTASGQAEYISAFIVVPTKAYIEIKVVAKHQETNEEYLLRPSFTMEYNNIPQNVGETITETVDVPLIFPVNSPAGTYLVTGYVVDARVYLGVLSKDVSSYLPSQENIGYVNYIQASSGGSSGGETSVPSSEGASVPAATPDVRSNTTMLTDYMFPDGEFKQDAEIVSVDDNITLGITDGTKFFVSSNGNTSIGTDISIYPLEDESKPEPPEEKYVLGLAYEMRPKGASFDPYIEMTFSYDESEFPFVMDEDNLVIAWWDEDNEEWVEIEDCVVDTENNTITGKVTHFTVFSVIGSVAAADISIISLDLSTKTVDQGSPVTVSVTLQNTGGVDGDYSLSLTVNGEVVDSRQTTVIANSTKIVDFTIIPETDVYHIISVNGYKDGFSVRAVEGSQVEPDEGSIAEDISEIEETPEQGATVPDQAELEVTDFYLSSDAVDSGSPLYVYMYLVNDHDYEFSQDIEILLDGVTVVDTNVIMDPGSSQLYPFTVICSEPGSHVVSYGAYSLEYVVNEISATTEDRSSGESSYWWMIWTGIAVIIAVIGSVFAVKRYRQTGN